MAKECAGQEKYIFGLNLLRQIFTLKKISLLVAYSFFKVCKIFFGVRSIWRIRITIPFYVFPTNHSKSKATFAPQCAHKFLLLFQEAGLKPSQRIYGSRKNRSISVSWNYPLRFILCGAFASDSCRLYSLPVQEERKDLSTSVIVH